MMTTTPSRVLTLATALLTICSSAAHANPADNPRPVFIHGTIYSHYYDGKQDDLLTAGLGAQGLAAPESKENLKPKDLDNPTASELRKLAIYSNYNAIIDVSRKAGYGRLYGPNVPDNGHDGRVAGWEYLAYSDNGTHRQNVVLMVHIPDTFNSKHPCIITGPSSGSRGIYGAIGTSGAWGLKNGCAVAYTDKGTGNGVDDLSDGTINLIDGTRMAAAQAGKHSQFTAQGDIPPFNQAFPYRIAMKHAHSQQNPEADWGKNVLQAIEFAFYVLNLPEHYGTVQQHLTPDNTLVIASSISNGGAASLRAAEQDTSGLIDGIVVSEPNINPRKLPASAGFDIQQGNLTYPHSAIGKPLVDYVNYYNLYQPCASADHDGFPSRCTALAQAGLLQTNTLAQQIAEAQQKINDYAILLSTNPVAYFYAPANIYASIATLYPMAYGRFQVTDNLCNYSYAYVLDKNSTPQPKPLALLAMDFAEGGGIPPTHDTFIIANPANDGAGADFSSLPDKYLAGALCTRTLVVGANPTGKPLTSQQVAQHQRVKTGLNAIYGTGNLQGKPALIIHGRDDALIAVNHASRYYYGLNRTVEAEQSRLAYIEVKHANHLDAFNNLYPFLSDSQIPLHYYFHQGLDLMYAHLLTKGRTPLPTSQVVPTHPSQGTLKRYINLPNIGSSVVCPITFDGKVLNVPECEVDKAVSL